MSPTGFLLLILVFTALLFMSDKLRPDLIALLTLTILALTNLITPIQAFSGLSSPSVILLLAVFIMTGALFQTGFSQVVGRWLLRVAGQNEGRMVALVMLSAGGLSLFMNNIASGAVLLPAIMDVTRRTRLSPSRLLIPMAFATQLAGMATLFTTSNLVASGILHDAGLQPFGLFDFLSVGGPIALVGITFMVLVGRRWLPQRRPAEELQQQEAARVDLLELYQIRERLHEIHLNPGSPLAGKALVDTGIGSQLGLTVLAIERSGHTILSPGAHEVLGKNDVLVIAGRDERVRPLENWGTTIQPAAAWPIPGETGPNQVVEVMLAPHSSLIGQTLKQLQFRSKYGLNVIALWRNGQAYRTGFSDHHLQGSDVLLVAGPVEKFRALQGERDWLVLQLHEDADLRPQKMKAALLILALSLVVASTGVWPVSLVMFTGALAMILAGCLTVDEAYRAIDLRSIFLVGGMLSVGFALTSTGAASQLGKALTDALGPYGPMAVATGLMLVTTLLNQFIPGGSAVPAVLTPIAIAAARHLGADPRAFALVVAVATGTSLLTPFAHPVNVLVMGPGGYKFGDYFKAGLPLVLITWVILLVALSLFWHVPFSIAQP